MPKTKEDDKDENNMQELLLKLLQGQQEQLKRQEERQEEQFKQQEKRMQLLEDILLERRAEPGSVASLPVVSGTTRLMADLSGRLAVFNFDPESDQTFSKWYERYGEVLTVDGERLDDKSKVRLLVGKLSNDVFDRYTKQILPNSTADVTFDDTIKILKEMFDVKTSVFSTRYHCLKIEKKDTEDYMEYTGRVNEQCEKAKLQELDKDGLKALLWIYGLKSNRDAELRQRLLMFLDRKHSDQKTVTLHNLYKECDLWLYIKREAKMVETGAQKVNMNKERQRR